MARIYNAGFEYDEIPPVVANAGRLGASVTPGNGGATGSVKKRIDFGLIDRSITFGVPTPHSGDELFFKMHCQTIGSSLHNIEFGFDDGTSIAWYSSSGNIEINGSPVAYYSTGSLSNAAWFLVEFRFSLGASGVIQLRFNGNTVATYTGAVGSSGAKLESYQLFGGSKHDMFLDDVAINDTSGSHNNSWVGNTYVIPLIPNGNGDISEWVGSDADSIDNYLLVDDSPDALPSDTEYVSQENDDKKDLYQIANLPSLGEFDVINNVQVVAVARKQNEGEGGKIELLLKDNSVEIDAGEVIVPVAYSAMRGDIFATNPNTGVAWTESEINSLQIGFKKITP